MPALTGEGALGQRARLRLLGEDLSAPELMDVEVASAWRKLVATGKLDARSAELALVELADLRIVRVSHRPLLERCWQLRGNVTVYDATYIALAEMRRATFLTADRRLASVPGTRCAIEVFD